MQVKNQSQNRNAFTQEEDEALKALVAQYGDKAWKKIGSFMPHKNTRQCRERYQNYLAPYISTRAWSAEEDSLLRSLFQESGPKWAKFTAYFPDRSPVNIKNRYTSLLTKDRKHHLSTSLYDNHNKSSSRKPLPLPMISEPSSQNSSPLSEPAFALAVRFDSFENRNPGTIYSTDFTPFDFGSQFDEWVW